MAFPCQFPFSIRAWCISRSPPTQWHKQTQTLVLSSSPSTSSKWASEAAVFPCCCWPSTSYIITINIINALCTLICFRLDPGLTQKTLKDEVGEVRLLGGSADGINSLNRNWVILVNHTRQRPTIHPATDPPSHHCIKDVPCTPSPMRSREAEWFATIKILMGCHKWKPISVDNIHTLSRRVHSQTLPATRPFIQSPHPPSVVLQTLWIINETGKELSANPTNYPISVSGSGFYFIL